MWTVLYIGGLRLWNNKLELCLALVVPIAFFSIFALIFSRGIGEGATDIVKLGVVNDSDAPLAEELVNQLQKIDSLDLELLDASSAAQPPGDRIAWARDYMLSSDTKLILWIGQEFGRDAEEDEFAGEVTVQVDPSEATTDLAETSETDRTCRLLIEGSDPIAPKIVSTLLGGLLAQLSGRQVSLNLAQAGSYPPPAERENLAAANRLAKTLSNDVFEPFVLPSVELTSSLRGATQATPVLEQLASDRLFLEPLDLEAHLGSSPLAATRTPEPSQAAARRSISSDLVQRPTPSSEVRLVNRDTMTNSNSPVAATRTWSLDTVKVFGEELESSKIAMYAAGIAVMFLLFSASGAGGSLLEEEEAGTLERLLTSQLTFTQLLAGKWLYITALGSAQLTLMFAWAQLVFGVPTSAHLPAFFVMTIATAGASASLSLLLAVVCRSRAQLNAVAIVLILAMSALGGSMVPRYLMSEDLQQWGQVTFNAWAIDGFHKIFWQNQSVFELGRELSVMGMMTIGFALVARLLSGR